MQISAAQDCQVPHTCLESRKGLWGILVLKLVYSLQMECVQRLGWVDDTHPRTAMEAHNTHSNYALIAFVPFGGILT